MRMSRRFLAMAAATTVALLAAACGGGGGEQAEGGGSGSGNSTATPATIRVPDDHPTIQEAVDAAEPGDLVLISAGVYNEAVDVTTDELTIRGIDRNEVILDGEFELENGIRVLEASGVAVENLTARNYTSNGFFWTGVDGYRGSYLTAYRNGDYGIYAFDSVNGRFEESHASGSPDAGFYIGECYPCNAVIENVISEHNGLGYSGTNAGGDLFIINSTFRFNRAGIVPNSGSYELCYPERESTLVGNTVHDNNNSDAPAISVALLAQGNGILVAGGVRNDIERNLVFNHDRIGIGLVPFPEEDAEDLAPDRSEWETPCAEVHDLEVPPIPEDQCKAVDGLLEGCVVFWHPYENVVTGNVVSGSGTADLVVGTVDLLGEGVTTEDLGNCFSDNEFETTAPLELETLAPCEGDGSGDWDAGAANLLAILGDPAPAPPKDNWKSQPVPGPQPNMPDAQNAPASPATPANLRLKVDLAAIKVPDRPSGA
jgi:hypothetical protein